MSRLISNDFIEFSHYLSMYSLEGAKHSTNAELKRAHKYYYSILNLWAQFQYNLNHKGVFVDGYKIEKESALIPFLREAISDIGSGLFCCIHGAYKPAHMSLRSSIENFLRFSSGCFESEALTTTSVHRLFAVAKHTPLFSKNNTYFYSDLKSSYGELCKYTHSASLDYMFGVHALSHFPAIDKKSFESWNRHVESICKVIINSLVLSDPGVYLKAHFKVKEVLDVVLSDEVRVAILRPGK